MLQVAPVQGDEKMAAIVHEDDRKLFVGALPQEAKDSDIKEYFTQFGDIENINLKMDPMTGRSRYKQLCHILDTPWRI